MFDMSNLKRIGSLDKLAPQALVGFSGRDAAALRAGAALTHGAHLFAETR
jgi:hypothetical protein